MSDVGQKHHADESAPEVVARSKDVVATAAEELKDYELWLRMMMRGYRRFYNLPDILVNYRDLPTGLHRHPRKVVNHAMKIWLRTLMRFCPDF